jgi:hypothetical protein
MRARRRKTNQPLTTERAVHLFQTTFQETVEACERMLALARKLGRMKPGSEAYLDAMEDVSICATLLKAKTMTIEREVEDIEDTLPD